MEYGINHPDVMQYTNAFWSEDDNNPRWEDGWLSGNSAITSLAALPITS